MEEKPKTPKKYSWADYPYPDWWEDQKEIYNPERLVSFVEISPWDGFPSSNWYMGFDKTLHDDPTMQHPIAPLHEVLWFAHADGFMIGEGWGVPLKELEADD